MVRRLCGLLLVIGVALSDCPTSCCCPRPKGLVLCESLGLKSLPHSVPLATAVLSVARNRLCDVDHLFLPFTGLQELSLSQNQLPYFPKGLPPSLEALQLQENRITYLTAGGLRQLGNLTRLDLEQNRLRVIQPGAFRGLGKLRVLNLRGNRLLSFPRALPPSLTHLDLSANCIAALEPASFAGLVNLQELKINSNCLRSVPERAFDGMPRLSAVELGDNQWACECEILYLYRWLLDGRLRLASGLVCTAPRHLARRPLLTLPVTAICPRALSPDSTVPPGAVEMAVTASSVEVRVLPSPLWHMATEPGDFRAFPTVHGVLNPDGKSPLMEHGAQKPGVPNASVLQTRYTLEELSYEDCLALNSTPGPVAPAEGTQGTPRGTDRPEIPVPPKSAVTTEIPSPVLPTNKAGVMPSKAPPWPVRPWDPTPVTVLLAVLCALVVLLFVAVLVVLKKILHRNQRVAPLQQS